MKPLAKGTNSEKKIIDHSKMIRLANIRESAVAARIHPLQRAAYAVEAERIGCSDFPPLRETMEVLAQRRSFNFMSNANSLGLLRANSAMVGSNDSLSFWTSSGGEQSGWRFLCDRVGCYAVWPSSTASRF